jgi:flavin reductase (DIM6/NTAB) family NADH-FMN oxidoreductase RutF/rubredoxin
MNPSALSKLGYGMYLVASRKGDKFNAQVANTVFQITSEPPTVAVSINKKNLTHEYIKDSRVFTASVLSQATPLSFIGGFGFRSGRDADKFQGVNYKIGKTEAPIVLDNAVAYLEAKVSQEIDVGTHTIFIGRVIAAEVITDDKCLTYEYYHQVKRGTTPKTAPSYIESKGESIKMDKYECTVCGYIYDPALGDPDANIPPGTPFEKLPEDWKCPVCGAPKRDFKKVEK